MNSRVEMSPLEEKRVLSVQGKFSSSWFIIPLDPSGNSLAFFLERKGFPKIRATKRLDLSL
jgi:hypothetical protein